MPVVLMMGLSACVSEPGSQEEPTAESSSKASAVSVERKSKVRLKSPSEQLESLVYLKDVSERWLVEFGFETQGKWIPKLRNHDGDPVNRIEFDQPLKPGDLFFHEEPMKNRFKFIEIEERLVHNERLNIDANLRYAIFEDQKEGKNGRRYEIPNRLPKALRGKHYQFDRTALLSLEGEGMDSDPFRVEEGQNFGLPSESGSKQFLLKSVTPEEVDVEWEEGSDVREKKIALKGSIYIPPKTIREVLNDGE